jgi:hypothetical protein
VTVTSNEARIEVKPLPPVPADLQQYIGNVPIVGPTSVKVDYSPDVVNVGESKTISIEVASEGNLNPLKSVHFEVPPGMKMYEERPDTKMDNRGPRLVMHKIFRYSLVPLKPGLFRFPGVKLAYFDPDSGDYRLATSDTIAFAVQGKAIASAGAETPAPELKQQPSTVTDPRNKPIPTLPPVPIGPPLRYEEPTLFEQISRGISVQLSLLLLAVAIGLWTLFAAGSRWKRPAHAGQVRQEEIRRTSDLKELENLMRRMMSGKLGIPAESSFDQFRAAALREVKDKEAALAARTLLDDFEVLRYGQPGSVGTTEIEGLKARMISMLARL